MQKLVAKAIVLAILSVASARAYAGNASSLQIAIELAPAPGGLEISVVNRGQRDVEITQIELGGAIFGGVRLFLYDPYERRVEEAFATFFSGGRSAPERHTMLFPAHRMSRRFKQGDIDKYFPRVPRCRYYVAIYEGSSGATRMRSRPSNALKVCSTNAMKGY